jgi:hypothetical protein
MRGYYIQILLRLLDSDNVKVIDPWVAQQRRYNYVS